MSYEKLRPYGYQRMKRLAAVAKTLRELQQTTPRRRGVRRCSADIDRQLYLFLFCFLSPYKPTKRWTS